MKATPLEGYRHVCPICGREFWAMANWVYKVGYEHRPVYLCSWTCLQKKRKEKKKVGEVNEID